MHLLFTIYIAIVIIGSIFIGLSGFIWPLGGKKAAVPTPVPEPIKITLFPNCVICGKEWAHLPNQTEVRWCSNNHDTIWLYQEEDGVCSFDREVNNLYGEDYLISWNCRCSDTECVGKNIIYHYISKDYKLPIIYVEPVDLFRLPFNISRDQLYHFIQEDHASQYPQNKSS